MSQCSISSHSSSFSPRLSSEWEQCSHQTNSIHIKMSNIKTLLNEIAQYPRDAYLSSKRIVQLILGVHEECWPKQNIEIFASSTAIFIRNNFRLRDNEHLYLMRMARRGNGFDEPQSHKPKHRRWTFCWEGGAIYYGKNANNNDVSAFIIFTLLSLLDEYLQSPSATASKTHSLSSTLYPFGHCDTHLLS